MTWKEIYIRDDIDMRVAVLKTSVLSETIILSSNNKVL